MTGKNRLSYQPVKQASIRVTTTEMEDSQGPTEACCELSGEQRANRASKADKGTDEVGREIGGRFEATKGVDVWFGQSYTK